MKCCFAVVGTHRCSNYAIYCVVRNLIRVLAERIEENTNRLILAQKLILTRRHATHRNTNNERDRCDRPTENQKAKNIQFVRAHVIVD